MLKNLSQKKTSNKTKHALVKMKWVEAISTKRLTKDLINGYEILIDAKYFFSRIFKIYLEFIPAKKCI